MRYSDIIMVQPGKTVSIQLKLALHNLFLYHSLLFQMIIQFCNICFSFHLGLLRCHSRSRNNFTWHQQWLIQQAKGKKESLHESTMLRSCHLTASSRCLVYLDFIASSRFCIFFPCSSMVQPVEHCAMFHWLECIM